MDTLAGKAVRMIILASAPERDEDLSALWDEHSPQISLVGDEPGFRLTAGPFGILQFSQRTIHQIWLLAFASWKALHGYMAHLCLANAQGGQIDISTGSWAAHSDQLAAELEYANAINHVKNLSEVPTLGDYTWPATVPEPRPDQVLEGEDKAAYDLACIATAAAFLHEVHHIAVASGEPLPLLDEEMECDGYATSLLFDKVTDYAASTMDPADRVRAKRALGVTLCRFLVLVLTPVDRWSGSATHPPVRDRLRQVLDTADINEQDTLFWSTTASWLVAHLNLEGRLPGRLSARTLKELCYRLCDNLSTSQTL